MLTVVEFIAQLLHFVLQIHAVVPQRICDLTEILVLYVLRKYTNIKGQKPTNKKLEIVLFMGNVLRQYKRETYVFVLYLHRVVCSLFSHLGGLLCVLDAVDDLVVGMCHIHKSPLLGFCNQTAEKRLSTSFTFS